MAKKSRMGRNLGALLGGASRDRQAASKGAESVDHLPEPSAADANATEHDKAARSASSREAANESGPAVASVTSLPIGGSEKSEPPLSKFVPIDNTSADASPPVDATTTNQKGDRLRMLGVDQIRRGMFQPRRYFDQELLQELADSLKVQGMIQPILVREFAGAYELIAGERRWRAAQLAGLSEIPAIVREMDDKSVAAVSLVENIQRADLNPMEEARALQRLSEEFEMTHRAVAEAVGRSRAAVTNLIRLLDLHAEVALLVDQGELEMGHARALLGVPTVDQLPLAKRIIKQGLTVRAVEKLIRELKNGKPISTTIPPDPNIESLGRKLGAILGASVQIRHQRSGSGKLEISYTSVEELEGILAHIK